MQYFQGPHHTVQDTADTPFRLDVHKQYTAWELLSI